MQARGYYSGDNVRAAGSHQVVNTATFGREYKKNNASIFFAGVFVIPFYGNTARHAVFIMKTVFLRLRSSKACCCETTGFSRYHRSPREEN